VDQFNIVLLNEPPWVTKITWKDAGGGATNVSSIPVYTGAMNDESPEKISAGTQ
jgi:hypothetical protein